jgi:hypothetical protein
MVRWLRLLVELPKVGLREQQKRKLRAIPQDIPQAAQPLLNRRFRIIGVDAEERVEIVYGALNIDGARVEVREGVADVGWVYEGC